MLVNSNHVRINTVIQAIKGLPINIIFTDSIKDIKIVDSKIKIKSKL